MNRYLFLPILFALAGGGLAARAQQSAEDINKAQAICMRHAQSRPNLPGGGLTIPTAAAWLPGWEQCTAVQERWIALHAAGVKAAEESEKAFVDGVAK